jgi:hypothetical protein
MKEYEPHALAKLFPLMPASDIKELADDIKERGLQVPITLFEGKILDGQHRQEACAIAGVKPRYEIYKGNDPLGFVIAANIKRRHLTPSQKAMLAAEIAKLPHGGDRTSTDVKKQDANLQLARSKVAESLDISPRSVASASKILAESPALAKQVRDGKITVHAAEEKLAEKKAVPVVRKDSIGREIPFAILADWDRAHEVGTRLRSMVSKVKCELENGLQSGLKSGRETDKDLIFRELTNSIISDASALHYSLSQILPHVICPKCQGKTNSDCLTCRQRGFVSKSYWEGPNVTQDLRNFILKTICK